VAGLADGRELADMTVRKPNKSEETSDKQIHFDYPIVLGARGGVVVKVLRYKPAGRGFDSRCCHCNFSVT
jgi:hypothetical protein